MGYGTSMTYMRRIKMDKAINQKKKGWCTNNHQICWSIPKKAAMRTPTIASDLLRTGRQLGLKLERTWMGKVTAGGHSICQSGPSRSLHHQRNSRTEAIYTSGKTYHKHQPTKVLSITGFMKSIALMSNSWSHQNANRPLKKNVSFLRCWLRQDWGVHHTLQLILGARLRIISQPRWDHSSSCTNDRQ